MLLPAWFSCLPKENSLNHSWKNYTGCQFLIAWSTNCLVCVIMLLWHSPFKTLVNFSRLTHHHVLYGPLRTHVNLRSVIPTKKKRKEILWNMVLLPGSCDLEHSPLFNPPLRNIQIIQITVENPSIVSNLPKGNTQPKIILLSVSCDLKHSPLLHPPLRHINIIQIKKPSILSNLPVISSDFKSAVPVYPVCAQLITSVLFSVWVFVCGQFILILVIVSHCLQFWMLPPFPQLYACFML